MQLGSANSIDTTELLGFVRYLTHSIDDVSAFSDDIITAGLNRSQNDLQADILIATNWKIQGTTASQNLVAGQVEYSFPTGFLAIEHMEIDYINGVNTWVVANPVQFGIEENRAYSNTANEQSIRGSRTHPRYIIYGDTGFSLDPPAQTTINNGIKIRHTSKVTDLANPTDEAIFPEFSHKYLCYETAIELLVPRESHNLIAELKSQKQILWERIIKFYLHRNEDRKIRLRRVNHRIR